MNLIIIAKYNENLSWVKFIDKTKNKILIYNKGPHITLPETTLEHITLPNIGRESDTFLQAIISNYDNLSDYEHIIFLQGDPFSHFSSVVKFVNSPEEITDDITFLSDWYVTDNIDGLPHHSAGLDIKTLLDAAKIPYSVDDKFNFAAGAQYCVHRDLVLNKPVEWWKHLYSVHTKFLDKNSPYIFERIWPIIWDTNCGLC